MSELASGQTLHQRFELIRPLSRGGASEVWLVRDTELDERVVAKIIAAGADEERIALLRRECRHARRLAHPNIVPVFEFHRGRRHHLVSMPYVEGTTIGERRGSPTDEVLRLLSPIADALSHAHAQGVVHRDLKPSNVLVDADGRPHLLDFGISGLVEPGGGVRVAGGGSRYNVSPQQLAGDPPSPADDLYAFGALLYELLTGAPPFWPDVTDDQVREERPAPMRGRHAIPDGLAALVESLLAKSPADRPPDMAAVRDELERLLPQASSSPAPDAADGTSKVPLTPPPRAQAIRPVPPPRSAIPTRGPVPSRRGWGGLLILATAVGVVVVGLFVVLPWVERRMRAEGPAKAGRLADGQPPSADSTQAAGGPALPSSDGRDEALRQDEALRRQVLLKERARHAMERAAELRDALQQKGVALWGADELAAADRLLDEGDGLMGAAEYAAAEEAYAGAARGLEALSNHSIDVLEQALEAGTRALAAGEASAAEGAFELALQIEPGSGTARSGLKRARALDDVSRLLATGGREERAGRLEAARDRYAEAVALDPLSRSSREAFARVEGQIGDGTFARLMSEALAALGRGEHASARRALEQARAMRPGSAEVSEVLVQVEVAEQLQTIAAERAEAVRAEGVEDWEAAAARYGAVLDLDPTIRFAQEGQARSRSRADLARRLDYHVVNPGRLSSDQVFDEASDLLAEARLVEPAGPRHSEQMRGLEQLLAVAGTPVRVRIESDSATEVTIYHVGHLGTFDSRELELRPGTYTVIGSRKGYRDVRRRLVVVAGVSPEPLVVRCEEKT